MMGKRGMVAEDRRRTIDPKPRDATRGRVNGPAPPVPRQSAGNRPLSIERVQTGVRMEKRVLLVLKALAGAHDLTLGNLLEGIVLHVFEGKAPFGAEALAKIAALREVYGLDLTADDSHLLVEARRGRSRRVGGADRS